MCAGLFGAVGLLKEGQPRPSLVSVLCGKFFLLTSGVTYRHRLCRETRWVLVSSFSDDNHWPFSRTLVFQNIWKIQV